jgi:hypothetical protein
MSVARDSTNFVCTSIITYLSITGIGLEFTGSQKQRNTETNLEKDRFGGSRKMRQHME